MFNSHIISEDSIIPCFKHALHLYGDTVISSVNNLSNEDLTIQLFPNPASLFTGCQLQVNCNTPSTVEVFDATGRKIYTNKFFTACVLPSGNWQRGLYVVMVQTGGVFARKKLLLE